MAQQLLAQGHEVSRQIIIDAWAPNTGDGVLSGAPPDDATLMAWFIEDLHGLAVQDALPTLARGLTPPTPEAITSVFEQAQRAGLLPKDIAAADLQQHFAIFRRNITALLRYMPRPYPGRIHVLRATEGLDPKNDDPTMGWRNLACDGLEIATIAGNHYTILSEPQIQAVARQLLHWLEEKNNA
jgi:thioesterase domain-containing protein